MKRLIQYIGVLLGAAIALTGCKSDAEDTTMSMNGECVLLATADQADITLENFLNPVLQLAWDCPLWYSNDDTRKSVSNTLPTYIQTAADPAFRQVQEVLANGQSMTYTASNLNSFAKRLGLPVGKEASLYFRVKCGNLDIYSNVCKVTITPIYVNMTRMAVLNQEKTDTIARLHSPAEDGVYTGMMYASAWMNCWFMEADGTIWGNTPVSGTEFSLGVDDPWNCWFPDASGDFFVTVNAAKGWWSAEYVDTLTMNGADMSYNKQEKAWQLVTELEGDTKLSFAAKTRLFSVESRTDVKKAKKKTMTFGGTDDNQLVAGQTGEVTVTGRGTYTVSVSVNDQGFYAYKVEEGDQTQGGPVVPKPAEMKIYDKDKSAVLSTLSKVGDGLYSGSLTASWGWYNFLLYDAENKIWYGSDPTDKTALTSAEGFYNLWIDSESTGVYAIEVNLNTMKWSAVRTGDLPPSMPEKLYLYGDPDWNTATATLEKTGDAVYSAEVTIASDGNFKIVDGNTWYGLDPNDNTKLSAADGNWNIWIAAGTYTITVDWSTKTFSKTIKTE